MRRKLLLISEAVKNLHADNAHCFARISYMAVIVHAQLFFSFFFERTSQSGSSIPRKYEIIIIWRSILC